MATTEKSKIPCLKKRQKLVKKKNGWTDRQTDEPTDGRTDRRMNRRTDGHTDGKTDRRRDGHTDGKTIQTEAETETETENIQTVRGDRKGVTQRNAEKVRHTDRSGDR